jgi:hypothetical protein
MQLLFPSLKPPVAHAHCLGQLAIMHGVLLLLHGPPLFMLLHGPPLHMLLQLTRPLYL